MGNDPAYGADGGLAFTGFRFNAPDKLDNRVYVGKMDAILDHAAPDTLSFRGTLSNADQDNPNAPGAVSRAGACQRVVSTTAKALAGNLHCGAALEPDQFSGLRFHPAGICAIRRIRRFVLAARYRSTAKLQRARVIRILPVNNIVDNLTWTKNKHTITTGINFRFMTNNRDFVRATPFRATAIATDRRRGTG